MLRYLMTSWPSNTWKVKIWLSQKRKELSKWNKKTFVLVSQGCSFRQTSKNVAATTCNQYFDLPVFLYGNTCLCKCFTYFMPLVSMYTLFVLLYRWFSNAFWGYKNKPVAWNRLIKRFEIEPTSFHYPSVWVLLVQSVRQRSPLKIPLSLQCWK